MGTVFKALAACFFFLEGLHASEVISSDGDERQKQVSTIPETISCDHHSQLVRTVRVRALIVYVYVYVCRCTSCTWGISRMSRQSWQVVVSLHQKLLITGCSTRSSMMAGQAIVIQ